MPTVKHILETKGKDVWSIAPNKRVLEALELMAEKNVGALLVLDGEKIAGILSERDYARKIALKGKSSTTTPVSEIMTQNVITIHSSDSIDECMALMTANRIRHLPVFDGEELVGIISIGDVVREIISEHEHKIEQLENYIKGY